MARGINKVTLLGFIGNPPETHTFEDGSKVVNFSVATSEKWIDKTSGEPREKTEWHRCVAYRGLANVIEQYCGKGMRLYLEGKLETRKYTDSQGIDHYPTSIIVSELEMLGNSNQANSPQNEASRETGAATKGERMVGKNKSSNATSQTDSNEYAKATGTTQPHTQTTETNSDDIGGKIPF